jgi:hypothetical protein
VVPEILNAWLWQSRLSIRTAGARAFAAHGYVDPSYRPPRLPFVSVVGPLSLHVEPDRENGKAGQGRIKLPGYAIGQVRAPAQTVPATGSLALRFDGRASVTLALAGLPATAFGDPTTGPLIAAAVNTALAAALAGNQYKDADGTTLVDPLLLAGLASAGVKYSPQTQQFVITSTPGTAATGQRSLVEFLPIANDLAPALGFAPPLQRGEGRQRIHKLPAPRPMMVEVRVDLWAHSQIDMAVMFDGLAYAAPTRGRLALRPSLLAADVADGAFAIELLDRGEPTTLDSLVHLEGGDGLTERARGIAYTVSTGAAADPASGRFTLSAAGQLTGPVWVSPLLPDPLHSTQPAPAGFGVALGLALDGAAAAGDSYQLVALTQGATSIYTLALGVVDVTLPNGDPAVFGQVSATARLVRGGVPGTASATWRVPLAQLQAGGTLHATVTGDTGVLALAWDGEPQRLDDAIATPAPPVAYPGIPAMTADMTLALGGGAGAALPRPVAISHVHIFKEPTGPIDPKLRTSVAAASRLRPGDMIAIASCDDGWRVGETKSLALVESVVGRTVALTRPIAGAFGRGRALVYQDECFFFQTAVKRRDDLMNRLYHTSVDYRVSALLEDPVARTSTTLVLETQENVNPRGAPRSSGGHPGVTAVDADQVRGVN